MSRNVKATAKTPNKSGKRKTKHSAMQRFNSEYRIIRDENGAEIGHGIPNDQDARTKRAILCGAESGWLYQHIGDRNRARRRELGIPFPGTNRPYLKAETIRKRALNV